MAVQLRLEIVEGTGLELRGFAGSETRCNLFANVTVTVMEATAKVRAAIVGSDMMHYEAIVGRDFNPM